MLLKNSLRKIKNDHVLSLFKSKKKDIYSQINHILKKKNIDEKIKQIKILKDNFPNIPKLQLLYAHLLDVAGKKECFFEFEKYSSLYNTWITESGIDELKIDFISSNQFTGSLGCCFHIFSLLKAKQYNLLNNNNNKLFAIKPLSKKITSPAIYEYFNKYIKFINLEDSLINENLINFIELPVGMCLPMKQISPEMKIAHNKILSHEKKNNLKFNFEISSKHSEIGDNYLAKLGYNKNSFIVTIHVRESGYHNEINNTEYFRNGDIDTYIPAIKHIISNGGIVFRMGDPSMKKTPKLKGLIDYANSHERSDILDIYLGAVSKFCIGTSSGYSMIPYIFDVPILFTNMGYFNDYFMLREKDFFLPKKIFNLASKKTLTLKSMFTPPTSLLWSNVRNQYKKMNLEIIDNSPEDLLNATKDIMNTLLNNKTIHSMEISKIINPIISSELQKYTNVKLSTFAKIPYSFIENNPNLIR